MRSLFSRSRGFLLAFSVALAPAFAQTPPAKSAIDGAKSLLDSTEYGAAEKSLAEVRGADEARAKLLLIKAYLAQGKYISAETALKGLNAKKADVATLTAQLLRARGKTQEAIKVLTPVKSENTADGRRARLLLGELLIATGKRADAEAPLMEIIADYNNDTIVATDAEGLAIAGHAAHLLRAFKNANQLFKESERADKKNVERMLWFAELFLEKYDPGHAEELVKEALTVAPHLADAIVLLARVKLEQSFDFDAADKLTKEALRINPNHTGALAVQAGLALRDMEITRAEAAISEGFRTNPNDLELWSMKAATRFLADDRAGYETAKKETFTRNPEFATFFTIVGAYAEWEHRYDDMIAMMKEATVIDKDDGRAWAELGLWQMRSGEEAAGLDSLRKAYSKDSFNVRAYNTLNLYEKQLPVAYDLVDTGIFKIRYPKEERAVLERYVPKLLGEAWGSMKARYGFVPKTPVQIELYSTREQFSVRTSGLPNIGIQGVCFGRVVAAMSPKSEPFNWGNVLWHELGHVFAIQLSKNHVPRWFTEGLSEYETISRRPEWQRELDPELYLAIERGTLPGAVEMNRAFTHAENTEDVTVAYYAASQMIVYTVETYGMPSIVDALKRWGNGETTPDVISHAFGVPAATYDSNFRAWMKKRLDRYRTQFLFDERPKPLEEAKATAEKNPKDARAQVVLALAYARAHKLDEANQSIAAALALDPKFASAHYLAAKLTKDRAQQEVHLRAILTGGKDGYPIRMALADLADESKDAPRMRGELEAARALDPSQPEPLRRLYDLARKDKRDADEISLLRALSPLDQHDARVWRRLLEKQVNAKSWADAVDTGASALFMDVRTPKTHLDYATALKETGDVKAARYELDTVLLAGPSKEEEEQARSLLQKLP